MRILTTYTKADFDRFYAGGWWKDETFASAIRDAVAQQADKAAVIHGARRVTYAELRELVLDIAAGLSALGVDTEDVVSVQLPNTIELAATILAIAHLGAVYNPLNLGYRRAEVETITGLVQPTVIICPDEYRNFKYPELIDASTDELQSLSAKVVVGRAHSGAWMTFDDLIQKGQSARADGWAVPEPDPNGVFLLGATSGTTGDPKVYAHIMNTQLQEARQLNALLEVIDSDVFLAMAPMTHRGALMFGFCTAIAAGATLVLADAFEPNRVLDLFEEEKITAFMAIPTQVIDLLNAYEKKKRDVSSLRVAIMSGAPVGETLVERFSTLWPHCAPITGYGMSECGYSTLTRLDDARDKLYTSGKPAMGMAIAIRDDAGRDLPAGETGNIHIRGPYVCGGYFDNQQATRRVIDRDGWLASGDLGFLDNDGYLHPVGRAKHVIIRGGLKVHAEEVEFLLGQHPAVAGIVVVGIPDERLGERACACVIVRDASVFAVGDVQQFLEEKGVAKFTWPEFVQIWDAFPLTPVGKLDRREIQAEAIRRAVRE